MENDPPLSDAELILWITDNLEWDGFGYWMPETCIKSKEIHEDFIRPPTANEFRIFLSQHIRESKKA